MHGLIVEMLTILWQWSFEASNGHIVQVPKWAPGVIGQQPKIEHGDAFQYVSCVDLPTDLGVMTGALRLLNCSDSTWIEADVAPCRLRPFRG